MGVLHLPLSTGRKLLASTPASSPRGEEHTERSVPYVNEGSLDSDLAAVLGAMICALICVVGLISLLRLARCFNRSRMGGNSSHGVVIRLASTGLKKADLKSLPIVDYTSASELPSGMATDCPICLAEFGEGEKVRVLPVCNHAFHMECIDKWFTSHSSCPLCRHSLNLLGRNRKPRGAPVAQGTDLNNALNVVIEMRASTQAIPPRTETLERNPQEATEVTTSLPLPPSSVCENQSSCEPMNTEF